MDYNELLQKQYEFLNSFQTGNDEKIKEFLFFNTFHQQRPIKDVVSIFIQNPEAQLLGTFDYWKNYAKGESSVLMGQKSSVHLFNANGKVKEYLFDYAQTNIRPELYTPVPSSPLVRSDLTLLNSILELSNDDFLLRLPNYNDYHQLIDEKVTAYFKPTLDGLNGFSDEEKRAALAVTKYNYLEHYGIHIGSQEQYTLFVDSVVSQFDVLTQSDSPLRVFSLANNLSKELERVLSPNLENVKNLTDKLITNQNLLNKKLDEITVEPFPTSEEMESIQEPLSNRDNFGSLEPSDPQIMETLKVIMQGYEANGFNLVSGDDYFIVNDNSHDGLLKTSRFSVELFDDNQIYVEFFNVSENTPRFKAQLFKQILDELPQAELFEDKNGDYQLITDENTKILTQMLEPVREDIIEDVKIEDVNVIDDTNDNRGVEVVDEVKEEPKRTLADSLNVHSASIDESKDNFIDFDELEVGQTYITSVADYTGTQRGYFKVTSKNDEEVKGISIAERIPNGSTPNPFFEFEKHEFYYPDTIESRKVSFKDWFSEERFTGIATDSTKEQFDQAFKDQLLSLELPHGSGFAEGKYRIYYFFKENKNIMKNDPSAAIRFLKDEYGVGGYGDGIWGVMHDAKGLHFEKPIRQDYSWKQVADTLDDLINKFDPRSSNRYLGLPPEGKREYEEWLEDEEAVNYAKARWGEIKEAVVDESNEMDLFADFSDEIEQDTQINEVEEKTSEPILSEKNQDVSDNIGVEKENSTPTEVIDFSFPQDLDFYPSSPLDKVNANIEAIKLSKQLTLENRLATDKEQNILAKYVGWGGLANTFFDESNPRFDGQRKALKELVSPREFSQMRESSLTAYYTDPKIIEAIYRQLEDLDFKGGRILDPSMGSGNFFSAMPRSLKENSSLYGVELDTVTGSIAKQLHQGSNIQIKGFQDTNFSDDGLDLVISNVPFGSTLLTDEKMDRAYSIHDYFFKKGLNLVHEGGYVAFITSTFTMDKTDNRFRKELASQANLVGAVRLPDNAFKAIAGTDVTSDILIFQKSSQAEKDPLWLNTTAQSDFAGNTIHYNSYFEHHKDKVLGDIEIKKFNNGTLSVTNKATHDELIEEVNSALNFEKNDRAIVLPPANDVFEPLPALQASVPLEVISSIEPFTILVHQGKPYYSDGKNISLFQKESSVTLNENETRQSQLKRYKDRKSDIFDAKEFYKTTYAANGYIDDFGNFNPDDYSTASINDTIPNEVRERWNNKDYKPLLIDGKRYSVSIREKKQHLMIETRTKTQYRYHVDYSSINIKAMDAMVKMRHKLQDMLRIQHIPNYNFDDYEKLRLDFNEQYDRFVEKFGTISSPSNRQLFRQDDYYEFLASTEVEKENKITKEKYFAKGDVFDVPTIQAPPEMVTVNSARDALLASLNHKGKLDFEYMEDVYLHSKEQMVEELGDHIFYTGAGQYEIKEDYLSGDVKTKLDVATSNQTFSIEDYDWSKNIHALEDVQPKDLTISDINFKFGTRFIPTEIYKDFLIQAMDQGGLAEGVKVAYNEDSDSYAVHLLRTHVSAGREKYGHKGYDGEKLAAELLNQRTPKIYMPDPNDETGRKRVLDNRATAIIQEKGNALIDSFKDWVLKTPSAQTKIVKIYNEEFNRYVPKTYDGSSITVNGLSKKFQLRPHQKNAIMRIVQDGRAGLAHEVGSGKTLTMLASNMKLQELGVIKKPLFVVPKPLIEQFAKEIYTYFPDSRVLVAHSEDFTKENRKRFISRIANGNYNAIVIADSQFAKVGMSKAYQEHFMQNELDSARESLAMHSNDDSGEFTKSFTVKQIERKIKGIETRLENLQKTDTDTFIAFEELGIDFLYVDEFHNYKNLAPNTQLENVKGVADTRSQKALDMKMKIDYLHSQYNNRHVVGATGTVLSNSVVELHTMLSYLAPDSLEKYGVANFDSWVSAFGVIEDNFELTVSGTFKVNRRFTKFGNLQELMNMFGEVWDIQTQEMLNLPVPEHEIKIIESHVTPKQAEYIDDLVDRATQIERGAVKPWEDNMLKIVSENKKLTLDMRILDQNKYDEFSSSKIKKCVDNVFEIYTKTNEQKSTQIIFLDQSVPLKYRNTISKNADGTTNTFSAYDEIKRSLIEKGIPADEIKFIHEAGDNNKEALMKDMRLGKVRILLGSTTKAGTGLNIQDKAFAAHHLDLPWRPSDITQRNGRIVRQGNENPKVLVFYYINKGSMDSYLWQTMENKQKFIGQLMAGKTDTREMEDVSAVTFNPSLFKQVAEDNPQKAEFMKLEMSLKQLGASRNRFYESQSTADERSAEMEKKKEFFETRMTGTKADIQTVHDHFEKPFRIDVLYQGVAKTFTEDDKSSEIGEFLAKRLEGNILENNFHINKGVGKMKLADYRGFEILQVVGKTSDNGYETLILRGKSDYSLQVDINAPTGILTRIDNKLTKGIKDDLERTTMECERLQSNIDGILDEKGKPYPKEQEFLDKKARYDELKIELTGKTMKKNVSNDHSSSMSM